MPAPHQSPLKGLVTAIYARSLFDYLRDNGQEPSDLYPAHWVAEIESPNARAQLPLDEWIAMFDIATRALKDPDLALKAGASVKTKHLGALAGVLMSCTTFQEMAEQMARYIRLLGEIGQPTLDRRGNEVHVAWTWPYPQPPPASLAQFMQATRVTYARWLLNRPDFTVDAHFHFARPRDTRTYKALFGGRLHFAQPASKLVFPAEYLEAPIVSAAGADAQRRAEFEAQSVLRDLGGETDFMRQLKVVISQALGLGQANLRGIAAALELSPRSLQRRLDEHGQSFRTVLDEVRAARAKAYLQNPALPLAQIAFLLGYTEQSTFQAAFRRWTGLAPGRWREREVRRP